MPELDKYDYKTTPTTDDVPVKTHRYVIEHLTELRLPTENLGTGAINISREVLAWRQVADIETEDAWGRAALMKYTTDTPDAPGGWYRVIRTAPSGMEYIEDYFVTPTRVLSIERANYNERDEAA